jgi:hypothetical protein
LREVVPQPKKYRWPGGSKVRSVRMRQPPNSMSAVGPPMWVNRVSDMRRNLGGIRRDGRDWDGLGLNRVRHAPRHVIARWPRVKYLGSGTSEATSPTRCTTGGPSHCVAQVEGHAARPTLSGMGCGVSLLRGGDPMRTIHK